MIGSSTLTTDHLNALPYIKSCLLKTLRLDPPAQAIAVRYLAEDGALVVLGDRYMIHPDQTTIILIPALHRDPAVFGDGADKFRPERMTEEKVKNLPRHAFKPFDHSPRLCIGGDFALQEATVTIAILFQKFDFALVDPDYELQYQPSLNRKPKGLSIYARLRPKIDILSLHRDL